MSAENPSSSESFAALRQQVVGIEDDYRELKGFVVSLDKKMDHGFNAIALKLDVQNKTPWSIIFSGLGVMLTFCMALGALAYLPIKADLDNIKYDQVRRYDQVRLEYRQDLDHRMLREQRMWDQMLKSQSQLDKLSGALGK